MEVLFPDPTDTGGYAFWLLVLCSASFVLERLAPWRRSQGALRRELGQDLGWLLLNGHLSGALFALVGARLFATDAPATTPGGVAWIAGLAPWAQFAIFFPLKDLAEWALHYAQHRNRWLWEFHKVHHSLRELDWLGAFRFHWVESALHGLVSYLPLILLGLDEGVVLAIAVVSTLVGQLNHANLALSWGPLRYLLNSPRMHVWHHARELPPDRPHGANFAVAFSLWDWLFGTAWWPRTGDRRPRAFGFPGVEGFPRSLLGRFLWPLPRLRRRDTPSRSSWAGTAPRSDRAPS